MPHCAQCESFNADGLAYCGRCGSPLPRPAGELAKLVPAPPLPTPGPAPRPVLTGAPLRDVDLRLPPGAPTPIPSAPPPLAFVECVIRQPCTVEWSAMGPTGDPNVRHCGQCDRDVHAVRTAQELDARRAAGDCVAVFEVDRSRFNPFAWRPRPKPR